MDEYADTDMTIWAIVPVKPFALAKSRLSGILAPTQRAELSRYLFTHTLSVLAQVPLIRRTLVISRDPAALALARKLQANTVTESGVLDLNAALSRAAELARNFGAHAALILPTDLPLLTPADVIQMLETRTTAPLTGRPSPAVIIAPDRHEAGTNALFVRPVDVIPFSYGADSLATHLRLARAAGVQPRVVRTANLALDLDTPADWTLAQPAPLAALPSW